MMVSYSVSISRNSPTRWATAVSCSFRNIARNASSFSATCFVAVRTAVSDEARYVVSSAFSRSLDTRSRTSVDTCTSFVRFANCDRFAAIESASARVRSRFAWSVSTWSRCALAVSLATDS